MFILLCTLVFLLVANAVLFTFSVNKPDEKSSPSDKELKDVEAMTRSVIAPVGISLYDDKVEAKSTTVQNTTTEWDSVLVAE